MLSVPGILTVTLHEAVGLPVADHYKERPTGDKHTCTQRVRGHPATCPRCNYPYARLEYEKCQASLDCYWGTTESPVWIGQYATCKFDVSRFSELAIRIYVRDPDRSGTNQDVLLGIAQVDPFEAWGKSEARWLNMQDGTGKIRVSFDYEDAGHVALDKDSFENMNGIGSRSRGYVFQVRKKDTRRTYAQKRIRTAELGSKLELARPRPSPISHPFIVPLAFTFQSEEDLCLLSPFIEGGHLFNHLQKERCFDVGRTQFYAAEILCALEYLHDTHGIYSWLKPRNVLLDSFGHVVLCGFGLFDSEIKKDDCSIYGTPEYPAPELLLGQEGSRVVDWWTLGIFLYEMLTGLPLFYDEDFDKIRPKILNQPIQLPESLPLVARDIITKLLDRRPEQRLGADGGASEIKAHPFFDGVDWDNLLQRRRQPSLKPSHAIGFFKQHGVNDPPEPKQPLFPGFTYNRPVITEPANDSVNNSAPTPEIRQERVREDDGWELVWEEIPREFCFHNRFTGENQAPPDQKREPLVDGEIHDVANPTVPSQNQKQIILEATLQAGHDRVVSQLLEYGMDLNVWIFNTKRTTPLEWAVEHENTTLVSLFLDKGADANFPGSAIRGMHQGGPPLIKAVEKGNREVVEILARSTDRVALTRALGLAVGRRDMSIIEALLQNGAQCDFKEGDRPLPQHPLDDGCYFRDLSEPEEFTPPLVRAVKRGQIDIVRALLSYGVDANVSYHGVLRDLDEMMNFEWEPIKFSCGRVVQLAIELGYHEIVQLLLAHGADIDLVQPVWAVPGHDCGFVPRPMYQKVVAGLRKGTAARKGEQNSSC
ncbi:protein kinase [Hypomontagnella monticulosa]|nr:protein kinase [Hypomontagnella monticulosa]